MALGVSFQVGCGRTDFSDLAGGSGAVDTEGDTTGEPPGGTTDGPGPISTSGPNPTTTGPGPDSGDTVGDTEGPEPPPGECEVDSQCETFDPCMLPRCSAGECRYSVRDRDDDGFPPFACGGEDCNDLNALTYPGAPEVCADGDDNDCNGVFDCSDPACEGVPNCGCDPNPDGEVCGNGVDDDCDRTVDCLDTDCLGTPTCGCARSERGVCANGFDDDCDGWADCEDEDCAEEEVCACQGAREQCDNGEDDDCDGLIDCIDPDCAGTFNCTCPSPPRPEACDNGTDDDCDGDIDCADPECAVSPSCRECSPEICDSGEDEDCDGRIDCADDACAFDPQCQPVPEVCNNGVDDDNDTLADCDDPDCANVPVCEDRQGTCLTARLIGGSGSYFGDTTGNVGQTSGSCGGDAGEAVFYMVLSEPSRVIVDSIGTSFDSVVYVRSGDCGIGPEVGCDDDSAGSAWAGRLDFELLLPGTYFVFLDGFTIDPFGGANEGPFQLNVEIIENPGEICDNGRDDDGDVYADCADPDCAQSPECVDCRGGPLPEPEFGPERCTDGLDNDCDGLADCADDDCSASDYYVTECCNGTDENGNGIPDDFNCRCNNDSECGDGQICYTHTSNTCGIPCPRYFGDVCPFVAPGASCNQTTEQCEY